jgi:FMN phosphatase YigB (HAD superfamily)
MIKCITFDLDDTLWKIEPVITRIPKVARKKLPDGS